MERAKRSQMKVVVVKYNAGNIRSVLFALERIGIKALVSDVDTEIRSADRVIFPGVGEAGSAMRYLKERKLDLLIPKLTQPVLGICLGMQLMCRYSDEGNTPCLGIFDEDVKAFPVGNLKVPQIGWNEIAQLHSPLFEALPEHAYMYFVHGYYVDVSQYSIARTNYGFDYSAALRKDNFFAVQFHPEKSGERGEQILKNFIYSKNLNK